MTDVDTVMGAKTGLLRPEPARDRWGRYLIGGKARVRATTVAGTIKDRFGLNKWEMRMAVRGIAVREDLYALAAATHPDDRDRMDEIVAMAKEAAGAGAGSNMGTALHEATARIDLGQPVQMPAPWDKDVDAYCTALIEHHVEVLPDMVERIILLDAYDIGGTLDRIVRLPGCDMPVIADVKTAKSLSYSWGEIAVQLAMYAHADGMLAVGDDGTGPLLPMPAVDQNVALVIWLPVGQATCELHWVDIDAGWEAMHVAVAAREWQRRKDLAWPYRADKVAVAEQVGVVAPSPPPPPIAVAEPAGTAPTAPPPPPIRARSWDDRSTSLRARMLKWKEGQPAALAWLAEHWPATIATPKLTEGWDSEDCAHLELLLGEAERECELPFDPPPMPPSAPHMDLVDVEETPIFDEGTTYTPNDMVDIRNVMRARFDTLTMAEQSYLNGLHAEAHAAGHPLAMTTQATHRRALLIKALMTLVALDEPAAIDQAVTIALGERAADLTTGAALGACDVHAARTLAAIADGVEAGTVTLDFTDAGQPRLVGLVIDGLTS